MGIELGPDDPTFRARAAGCTCTWLRGFGVGPVLENWIEKIIWRDPDCTVKHDKMR